MTPIVPPSPKRVVPGRSVQLSAETLELLRLYATYVLETGPCERRTRAVSTDRILTVALHRLFEHENAVAPWFVPAKEKATRRRRSRRKSRESATPPATTEATTMLEEQTSGDGDNANQHRERRP